jgi:Ni,Fe-hydrogenase III small subunit
VSGLFSKILRTGLVTEEIDGDSGGAVELARQTGAEIRRRLGRALAIREVDAGSCNGCEIEISGLTGPVYDCERFGIHFVASPRHADMLLVTGPVTRNMEVPLLKTYEATPAPKLVVAIGDCAKDCGVFKGSYAVIGSVADVIPVDAFVTGCPPEPAEILHGILAALGRLPQRK